MRRNTPLITLLTGAALGVVLLIASMLQTPTKAPTGYTSTATSAPASNAAASSAPATASPESSAPATSPQASPTPTGTAYGAAPASSNYAGRVNGGGASLAVSIHGSQAIAYVCNGSAVEAWLKGTVQNGRLVMTGKNKAKLTASYGGKMTIGAVVAHGTHYSFSVAVAQKPSGLYQATAVVRGAKIKAGWIVLADGSQVGSLETDADSTAPSATQAPMLDLATGTAVYNGVVLHATLISGVSGSGF